MAKLHQHGYVNTRKECATVFLKNAGMPAVATTSVSSSPYNTAVDEWLQRNWTTNWYVINTLGEELKASQGKFFRVSVSSAAYLKVGNAVGVFATRNKDEILHLYNTIGAGSNPQHPAISKAFNEMSYPERKAIMRANMARLEEVSPDEQKP